jgi:hypothetical protein
MTSGPVKIPPQQIPGQPASATPPAKPTPNVLLEKIPTELSDVKKTIEIKGQVIRDNRDGTLDIRTEKGDIKVSVNSRELNIHEGETVDVEIPPGNPPRTARVTPDQEPAPPPRTTQTPVDVEVGNSNQSPEIPVPLPAVLGEGQPVRLEPVPPAQAESYVPIPVETTVSNIVEIVEFQAQITVQNAESYVLAQIANIISPPLANAPVNAPTVPSPVSPYSFPSVITAPFSTEIAKPPFIMPLLGTDPSTKAAIPPPGLTLPLPDLASFSLTVNPSAVPNAIQNLAQVVLSPLRAEISALKDVISPAIVTPKVPPSPVITPEQMMKMLEKPLILQNQKAAEIPAIVIGMTAQNLPVIGMVSPTTGDEMFFIMHIGGGQVLPGTELTLTPQQALPASLTTPIMASINFASAPAYFLTPEPWPVMDEIYQALAQMMPHAAIAMSNVTPSPINPAQMGAAVLFFVAAVRGGDLTEWLGGGSVDALKRGGKGGLLSRLGLEGSTLSKLAAEPVSGEWRAVALPMLMENQMHKIALYYKNDSQQESKEDGGKQVRFIFDLSLTKMDKVQLDGLFRNKRLDLIVRTKVPFSNPMQEDMRRIYAGALGETSIIGDLSFQNRPEQWVTITPQSGQMGVSV